jgi:hypothetical protein
MDETQEVQLHTKSDILSYMTLIYALNLTLRKEKKDENMFFSCINELKAKIFLCMFFCYFLFLIMTGLN